MISLLPFYSGDLSNNGARLLSKSLRNRMPALPVAPDVMLGQIEATMRPLLAILIYDRDALFREALRNFLLAAGYAEVVIAATVREALAKLRCESYGHILIGISKPLSRGRRLAAIARKRQPEAKILFLVGAQDQPFARDAAFEYIIKEYVFSNLLGLM